MGFTEREESRLIFTTKPFEIEVEAVRGCNMACDFCGNYSLPVPPDYMSMDTAETASKKLAIWNGVRVIFCGRGEPLLHPDIVNIVATFRGRLYDSQITLMTNGLLLKQIGLVKSLFSSGLNYLLVDAYGGEKREQAVEQWCRESGFPVVYGTELNVWKNNGSRKRSVVILSDLREGKDRTRKISGRCGAVNPAVYSKYGITPVTSPLQKKCTRPFRELEILWDGTIPLCCFDWVVKVPMANINSVLNVRKYWEQDERLSLYRDALQNKCREFSPCKDCDYWGGARQGFLPPSSRTVQQVKEGLRWLS